MPSPLMIVGASVRAAAESAHAAGYQVYAIDMFNDRDLTEIAVCRLSVDYPPDLPRLAREFPEMPFLYTGALENYPDILFELSSRHQLMGIDPESLKKLRDPFWLSNVLKSRSLPSIELKPHDSHPQFPDDWLIKPFRSGHGMNIGDASTRNATADEYYQQFKPGLSVGALFLGHGESCQLIGCHQQLSGLQSGHPFPFQYYGAIAPLSLRLKTVEAINAVGTSLTVEAGLCGLFGCDFIITEDVPYLLEVNPRYTASTELWESLHHRSLISDHLSACHNQSSLPEFLPSNNQTCLKIILYAPTATHVPENFETCLADVEGARLADLPFAGSFIEKDAPFCSLLVNAGDTRGLLGKMRESFEAVSLFCDWDPRSLDSVSQRICTQIDRNIP